MEDKIDYRKLYYFIENDEGKWHYIRKGRANNEKDPFRMDTTIYHFNEWTSDPTKAIRHESEELTKVYLDHSFALQKIDNLIITEHEFVIRSTSN